MRGSIILAAAGAVLAGVVYSELAAGQDNNTIVKGAKYTNTANVEIGSYKPLTFWGSVSLGSAYYTNPQKARETNVAYSYDGPEFSDDYRNNAIWKLAGEGKINFGILDGKDHSISVLTFDEFKKKFSVRDSSGLPALLARNDIAVVASEKNLLGAPAKTTVVKTQEKRD